MSATNLEQVNEERQVLAAIYGEQSVSFALHKSDRLPASISISLGHLVAHDETNAPTVTLSTILPADYPSSAKPSIPTLRVDRISAARCSQFVDLMLAQQSDSTGEVCLFQYCETIVSILRDAQPDADQHCDNASASSAAQSSASSQQPSTPFQIFHGAVLTDRKSSFQAQLAVISSEEDVDRVLQYLKQTNRKIAIASHNTLAYRIVGPNGTIVQDCDDDGEKGAAKGILYVLQQLHVVNVVCIVTRWFGGIKLGPVRFKHICKVARDALEDHADKLEHREAKDVTR